ncbi:sulfotransferase 1C4-like [Haliotis asinina]|uniref:sulfotransferase 1C4-like n=1 Tax=Haliotis asinina TaxID=109174 RepID=UPI0035322D1B
MIDNGNVALGVIEKYRSMIDYGNVALGVIEKHRSMIDNGNVALGVIEKHRSMIDNGNVALAVVEKHRSMIDNGNVALGVIEKHRSMIDNGNVALAVIEKHRSMIDNGNVALGVIEKHRSMIDNGNVALGVIEKHRSMTDNGNVALGVTEKHRSMIDNGNVALGVIEKHRSMIDNGNVALGVIEKHRSMIDNGNVALGVIEKHRSMIDNGNVALGVIEKYRPMTDNGNVAVGVREKDHDFGELPDLRNSKGHGFYCLKYDGVYFFVPPPDTLKGGHPLDKIKSIKEVELKDDDIILCAYPKCGTHWLWEVIEMLISGTVQHQKDVKETRMIEFLFKNGMEALPPRRVFNTHLPLRMLPKQVVEKKIKCIQIMRNPKDTCVSYFNHCRDMVPPYNYEGDFVEFTEAFLTEKIPFGSYSSYILSWKAEVEASPELPVLELFYEDMKTDLAKCVKDIVRFLGITRTDQFCADVALVCSFKKMKQVDLNREDRIPLKIWADGTGGTFYRKGEIGDWKNWFTVAQSERFDIIWNKKMKDSDFEFTDTPV